MRWTAMMQTYPHVIKLFLFLECIVDVVGDERVHQIVLVVAIAIVCTIDGFALSLWGWFHLGNKLLEEPDGGNDEGRFAVGDVATGRGIEVLAEVGEQPPKGRAVNEHLKDCICKTHVSRVDETARTDLHDGQGGWTGCKEGQELGFFARRNG